MKIAYFSPFNPLKSGISDFSEEIVMKLKDDIYIDIFTDNYSLSNEELAKSVNVYCFDDIHNDKLRQSYDFLVYQVGNCKAYHKKIVDIFMMYGGILELHDVSMFHYWVESTVEENNKQGFVDIMELCHGEEGKKVALGILDGTIADRWGELPQRFVLNKTLIDRAEAVIVHSDFARQIVKLIRPNVFVQKIYHHTADIVEDYKMYYKNCRKKLGIPDSQFVVGSFGFASVNKRILSILKALKMYNEKNKNKIYYYIVGEIRDKIILEQIKKLELEKYVKILGYQNLDEFKKYIGACDVVLNLRYPTQGESSGSLHRALGMGKAVVVSNIGSFMEYPNDTVIKVSYNENEVEDICEVFTNFILNKKLLRKYEKNAYEYAKKYCDLRKNSKVYQDFFVSYFYDDFATYNHIELADKISDKLFELGLDDEKFINQFCEKIDLGVNIF